MALPWRKTLAMLELGAESIIVPVRADKRRLSPAPWRLSFLCTLAPAAADLDKCDAVQQSEALRNDWLPLWSLAATDKARFTNLDDHHNACHVLKTLLTCRIGANPDLAGDRRPLSRRRAVYVY